MNANPLTDPHFITSLRKQMLHFAHLQLGDRQQAEDAVQESLAGAMKNAGSFSGKAAWKSWVFAILRNKIADTLRGRYREANITEIDEQDYAALFDEKGYWPHKERPQRWHDPDYLCEKDEFWEIFELCLTQVPAQNARAFMMREFIGLETHEICREMNMSNTNLNVTLWRARMRLRECLVQRWFTSGEQHA